MDLNHIELPIVTITDLYRDSLVLPGESNAAPKLTEERKVPWPSLGGNRGNILVVVDHQHSAHIPDQELAFLTRMLTPCKLSLDDVSIINRCNYQEMDYKKVTGHFASKKVLLFGLSPVSFGLPVQFPEFQVQALQKIDYVSAPSLSEIEKDESLKRKCWESLKKIFNLG